MHKLSDMAADQREKYMTYYREVLLTGKAGFKFLEPAKEFNEWGLRFPAEYLNQVGAAIVMLPLELQADYVDIICKTSIDENNKDFINQQGRSLFGFNIENYFKTINATAIGNLAYVCLHCQVILVRELAEDALQKIFVKAKGQFSNLN